MSMKTRVVPVALLAVALLAVSGCTSSADAPEPVASAAPSAAPALTPEELAAWESMAENNPAGLGPGEGEVEYTRARLAFPLPMPAGTAIPEKTSFDFHTPGGIYDRGMGAGLVSWTWLCATESELLDALEEDDASRADATFDQLEAWMALPAEVRMFEGLDAYRSVVIDPARSGNSAPLATDRDSWCAQAPFDKL
jgi:hypothetical protein